MTFKPIYIKNFPDTLKKKLQHLAVDSNLKLSKYIIRILEAHVKEKSEFKTYGQDGHSPPVQTKD